MTIIRCGTDTAHAMVAAPMSRPLLALICVTSLLSGCEETPVTPECTQSSDCPSGKVCRDSACVADAVDSGTGGAGGGSTGGGGGGTSGGGTGGAGGGSTGGGGGDVDAGCTPRTCAGLGCGVFSDDCGGMITCTATCECTEQNFDTTCPSKPCMTLSGCVDFKCNYAAATCAQADGGLQTCEPTPSCSGAGCGQVCTEADGGCDSKLYACGGGVCANVTSYCDPSPMVMNGKIVYANRCIAPPNVGCGTCQLGAQRCDTTSDRFTCSDLEVPVADGGVVECDSTVAASTFIYVDPAYTGSSDGSKPRPFTTFTAAATAASARGARGIVIGGNPTFTETLVVPNGVSIYGGFGVSPLFVPDATKRPLWNIPSTALTNNRLVGASATGVSLTAVVKHIEVRTANLTANDGRRGASNFGFLVTNSPGLKLDDVIINAGNAGAGVAGNAGAIGTAGGNAALRIPGTVSCFGAPLICNVSTPVANQDGTQCGRGGRTQTPNTFLLNATTAGNGGAPLAQGGARGLTLYDNSDCSLNAMNVTAGSFGGNGIVGTSGADGTAGMRLVVSSAGVVSGGEGTNGTNGTPGTWGGGGGAGGSFMDGCMNDPDWGGPGGGGGAPGCGGSFGLSGGAGGASIGLLVGNSAGFSLTGSVQISAGNGGAGGRGGAGGNGGAFGLGESAPANLCLSMASFYRGKCGGAGGNGGLGGRGGHAGGSAGGDSVGIYCVGSAVPSATSATVTVGTPGAAGPATAPAQSGAAGVAAARQGC